MSLASEIKDMQRTSQAMAFAAYLLVEKARELLREAAKIKADAEFLRTAPAPRPSSTEGEAP